MSNKIDNIKVCHLTSVHPPFDIRIFHKECVSLVNAGYKVTLIAPIDKAIERMGVSIVPIFLPTSRLKRMLVVNWRMFSLALKQKAKIYHFHDPELMLCGIILHIAGKKVVYDIHENVRISISSKDWIPKIFRKLIGFVYFIFERFALLSFNALILAEESYRKNYSQTKATVILNYPLCINSLIVKDNSKNPTVQLIYAGVVHPLRGIWEMLNMVKWLKAFIPVTLTLIGELRPKGLNNEVELFIHENKMQSNIELVGKVEFSEVSNYLQQANVGISLLKPIPNYVESLPTKILEYMQHGLPVIGNNFDIIKSYVLQANTGICVNIEQLENDYKEVLSFLQDKSKLEQCAKNGISQVQHNWHWETQSIKLIELYEQLMQS